MARILMLDDDEAVLRAQGRLLRMNGNEVISAHHGEEGLDKLIQNPQIIFCDFNMQGELLIPVMDGYQFCKIIKTEEKYSPYQKIPIIGTGSFPDHKCEYLTELLKKPIEAVEYLRCIDKYCLKSE